MWNVGMPLVGLRQGIPHLRSASARKSPKLRRPFAQEASGYELHFWFGISFQRGTTKKPCRQTATGSYVFTTSVLINYSAGVRSTFFGLAGETGVKVVVFARALPIFPQPPAPRFSFAPPRRNVLATLAPGIPRTPPFLPLPASNDFMLWARSLAVWPPANAGVESAARVAISAIVVFI